jgi:predicted MFS family arabinose efflux permease
MSPRQLKTGYFVLEGLNSFATVYYLYYLYFFMQSVFQFGNQANLELAALNGALYMVGSFWGGKFAQRVGYFPALKLGFVMMIAGLAAGLGLDFAGGQILVMAMMVIGMCFTWPSLEALISEGEDPAGMQHMVGIYNVVWAGTGALAYFTGGAMLEHLGVKSLFYVPVAVQLGQLGLTIWLEKRATLGSVNRGVRPSSGAAGSANEAPLASSYANSIARLAAPEDGHTPSPELNPRPIARARSFLRMAWLANPFAYVAINTLIAIMPGIAGKLGLSTMLAGFCCSVWCFARLGAFFGFWYWSGWHYRFRWLLGAFLAMMIAFAVILLAPNVAVLVLAQILFGCAIGLIYYSSLFYSMDLSDTKGEHGGIHEAAIGAGNFAGPAVGAASLHFLPQSSGGAAVAVSCLLLLGLGGLVATWRKNQG